MKCWHVAVHLPSCNSCFLLSPECDSDLIRFSTEEVALVVAVLVPALGFAFVVASVSFVVCYWLNMTARYSYIHFI